LLLRGRSKNNQILVYDVIIPPLAVHGRDFSAFPSHMLPMDFFMVGIAHSYPSGMLEPSTQDLNQFYGRLMMLVIYPFDSEAEIAVFDRKGETVPYRIVEEEAADE